MRTTRWPVSNDCSNSDPLRQPKSLDIAKCKTRVRQSLLLCSDNIHQEPSRNSTQTAESHGRPSQGPSEERIEATVTGPCLLMNLNSLIPRWFLISGLVHRAENVTNIKKCCFLKRKLFVSVSNPETTAKTADAPLEGHVVTWNKDLNPLQVFPLLLHFYG